MVRAAENQALTLILIYMIKHGVNRTICIFFQEIKECQTSRTETDLSDIEKNLEEIAE